MRPNEAHIDVGELYRSLAARLEHIVRLDVRAPEPVIEDACQFAWSTFVGQAGRVRQDAVLSWLATTAVREAVRLAKCETRELSLVDSVEIAAAEPGPDELAEYRERLRLIDRLSERQQRLLWLHAFGLSYADIAQASGCTLRTVERQLLRAKRRVRELAAGG